jgi:hypothetical protein
MRIPAVDGIFVECKQAEMNELVTRDQPRGHSTAAGNLDSTKKPDVPRRTILTVTHEARCPEAITAMAHRLARLVYRMLKYGQHYLDKGATYYDQRNRQQQIEHLKKKERSKFTH